MKTEGKRDDIGKHTGEDATCARQARQATREDGGPDTIRTCDLSLRRAPH